MRILHPQFRDENADSKYPFVDGATLRSSDARLLDPRLFIDVLLSPVGQTSSLYLQAVEIDGLVLTFFVANNSGTVVCTGSVTFGEEIEGSIPLADEIGRPAGVFLTDPDLLASLQQWATGRTEFDSGATQFVPSVIIPSPEVGVRGLGDPIDIALVNDVWIVGEDGVIVTKTEENAIRVDIVGDPLFRRKLCDGSETFEPPRFLKTINNIPPTYWGGFRLQVGRVDSTKPALRIFAEDGSLVVGLALP